MLIQEMPSAHPSEKEPGLMQEGGVVADGGYDDEGSSVAPQHAARLFGCLLVQVPPRHLILSQAEIGIHLHAIVHCVTKLVTQDLAVW